MPPVSNMRAKWSGGPSIIELTGIKSILDFTFEFNNSAMDEVSTDCSMCTLLLVTHQEINFLVLKHLQQFADKLPSLNILKNEMV